ncbi:MAG: diguanylate cyclase [Methylophagaceae bacterium]
MKFRSLNQKLLISVLIIAFVLATIASIISFLSELERSNTQTEIMLNQLLDTVEDTAAIAAYSRNTQIAQDVLNGLLKNDIVYKAKIISEQSFNLESSKKDASSNENAIKRPLISPFDEGEILGYLLVQPTGKFKIVEAKHGAISSALTSIILIAVTAITIFLIVSANISKPLAHVSDTLHAIRLGQKQRISEIEKNKDDELGRLVVDINNLLKVLEGKYNEELGLRKQVEVIEQQLRNIFDSTSAGLFLLDEKGKLLTFNKTFEHILENTAVDISAADSFLAPCFREQIEFNNLISEVLETGQLETHDFSLLLAKDQGGKLVWVHCLLSKIIDESQKTFIEGVIFDVSERVENENSLTYQANHDKLTGLLRRQAAQKTFQDYHQESDIPNASFLFLDLDGFKQANDTYGHLAGDKVLMITSQRLVNCVRETDIICRLGGDEFLVILIDCSDTNVFRISKNIVSSLQKTFSIDDEIDINIGVSIGIAHLDENKQDFDVLVEDADEAMYTVKRNGKNGYCVSGESEVHHL